MDLTFSFFCFSALLWVVVPPDISISPWSCVRHLLWLWSLSPSPGNLHWQWRDPSESSSLGQWATGLCRALTPERELKLNKMCRYNHFYSSIIHLYGCWSEYGVREAFIKKSATKLTFVNFWLTNIFSCHFWTIFWALWVKQTNFPQKMSKNGTQKAIMLTFSYQLLTARSEQASFEVRGTLL